MNNIYTLFGKGSICILFFFFLSPIMAQEKKAKNESHTIQIVDHMGNPISEAQVASSKGRYTYTTDDRGEIIFVPRHDDMIKIIAKGFEHKIIPSSELNSEPIRLEKLPDFATHENKIYTVFDETNERRTVGAYSKVKGKELETNPTMFLMNALGGRLNGLFTMDNTLVPGFTNSTDFARSPLGNIIILVDGVERNLDYLEPETIESVQLLKDATLKALYGGVQASAILLVKTKRGKKYENKIKVNFQSGIQNPQRLPKYLNSYDYATEYNKSLENSGLDAYHQNPEAYINGDPVLYPDIDYYDMFLNNNMTITRANAQFEGGGKNTSYFTHIGYQTNGGLEKFTKYTNKDQVFTIRGNVDNTLFDFITFRAGFNAALENKEWPNTSTQNFFNLLSNTRPNEFPIFIPGDRVGLPNKDFVLGGTAENQNNAYGLLMNNGYAEREYSYIQTDIHLDVDLDKWIKGLVVRPGITFDSYNFLTSVQGATYRVYEPVISDDGTTIDGFKSWGEDTNQTNKSRAAENSRRNFAYNLTFVYNRVFGKHDINALATYFQQTKEFSYLLQKLKRLNAGASINYMYDSKYIGEASLNYVGVGSFKPSKRFGVFPTFGAGWIVTEENFMKPAKSWLDYLKVKASYGILGSTTYTADGLFSSYLYKDVWKRNGAYNVGGYSNIAQLTQVGNPDVGFQKSYELNVGLDFALLNNSLTGSVGYFNNTLKGAMANLQDQIPGVIGLGTALMQQNYKEYVAKGWEAEVFYQRKFGDWKVGAGLNFTYGKADITKEAEPNYPQGYEGLRKINRMGDVLGFKAIGTFANQQAIDNSPRQLLGSVVSNDIMYQDTNKDGVIDMRDQEVIANTMPSIQYGITLKLEYKGFNLDVLGYGLAGFERVLNDKYHQIYGNRKYSNVIFNGLPNGNPHPELRAVYSKNNFINSDYWVVDGGFFKLRNVELGYTFSHQLTSKIGVNNLKIFARGANLFTISKIKDLDSESLEAGVSNFPLCMTITGGLSFSF